MFERAMEAAQEAINKTTAGALAVLAAAAVVMEGNGLLTAERIVALAQRMASMVGAEDVFREEYEGALKAQREIADRLDGK